MQIADGQVVTIEYVLKDQDGNVVESSAERGPVTFKLGSDRMLPGIANAIEGMEIGETRTGTIAPGELIPKESCRTQRVLLTEFPEGVSPGMGDRFSAKDEAGHPVVFEVFEKDDESVTVYLLHPLHEKALDYEVKVLAARKSNLPPPPPVDVPDMTEDLLEDAVEEED